MTQKKFRKLIRAHFTAYYMLHREGLADWIANAYRSTRSATAQDRAQAYEAIKNALPLEQPTR